MDEWHEPLQEAKDMKDAARAALRRSGDKKKKKSLQTQLRETQAAYDSLVELSPQLAVATMEGSRYVTMEERIVVCEEDDDSELAKRMMNSHGFCDLAQAYLSTPAGAVLLPKYVPTEPFRCGGSEEEPWSDEVRGGWRPPHLCEQPLTSCHTRLRWEDFEAVLRNLDEAAFGELLVVQTISMQEDAGAVLT